VAKKLATITHDPVMRVKGGVSRFNIFMVNTLVIGRARVTIA
jgi:hypothetical protein